MWKQPWGSAEGWAICAGLLITGFGLQLITGPVQAGLFQYPVNVAGGLIFLLVLCIGFVVSRKITVVQWFSGLTASITSLSALLSVVLVMGFVGPGIERITMSWPFVLLFLYFLFVLGFVTLKRIVSFRWRDVPFMLNHAGLFITLLAAILGNGDLRRLRMTVPLENPEWRASDEKNEMIELPLAIELRSFTIDEYPPKLMLIDNTTGKALPEKQPENLLVEETPLAGNLQGWKVEVTRSLPMAACVMGQDTEVITRAEEVALSMAVNLYIEEIKKDKGPVPSFNTFYEFVQGDFREILEEKHYREKDFDLTNFLNVLAPYYRGGEYDYLLNSDEQLDLLNKRFVVFEIDEIKEHKILFPVVTVIIMEAFINKMRRLHGVRKMIVVEEA